MSAVPPSKFFTWNKPRVLIDIRPAGAFQKGSLQGARSLQVDNSHGVRGFSEKIPKISAIQPLHLIDQNGSIATQLCQSMELKFLHGGYKHFKIWRDQEFATGPPVFVLGGYTGSGKTDLLRKLKINNHQVIDFEALAGHRGSIFGGSDKSVQPLHEHFQNDLLAIWLSLDPASPVWVEEKGPFLGQVGLPRFLFSRMQNTFMIHLDVPFEERLDSVQKAYFPHNPDQFRAGIKRLERRMGMSNNHKALHYYNTGQTNKYFELLLKYYDEAYDQRRKEQRNGDTVHIPHDPSDPLATIRIIEQHEKEKPAVNSAGNSIKMQTNTRFGAFLD